MASIINVEQEKNKHSEKFARHLVSIVDHKNVDIISRLDELEAKKNAAINVLSGDITALNSSSGIATEVQISADADVQTILVPASIFSEEKIDLIRVDAKLGIHALSSGLASVSAQLSNLGFLNG